MPLVKQNTVLILGAGASMPYGFPSGWQLFEEICTVLPDQTHPCTQKLNEIGHSYGQMKRFARSLWFSGRDAVDQFLATREEFTDLGKAAMAAILIPLEKTDRLFDTKNAEQDWYRYVFGPITADLDTFAANKLTVITFNYDRSLEQFLSLALAETHNLPEPKCAELLQALPIIHVHGSLGPIDSLDRRGNPACPYGMSLSEENIQACADSIRIVHEDLAMESQVLDAQQRIMGATRLVFVGFGFHPLNLERLDLGRPPQIRIRDGQSVHGTCLGLSEMEQQPLKVWRLYPVTARTLFKEHVNLFG